MPSVWGFGRAGAAMLITLIVTSPPVRAQGGQACGLQVSPAQVEQVLPASAEYRTTVTYGNPGDASCSVELDVTRLGHDIDGTPRYTPAGPTERTFDVDVHLFTLAPGAKQVVTFGGKISVDARAAYVGLLATYRGPGSATGTTVEARTQLASQFLLRRPKPWVERIEVLDVGLLQGTSGTNRVYATVKNTGNVHVRPVGSVQIRRGNALLARVELEPDRKLNPPAVLPGLARRFEGTWRPAGALAGQLKLRAIMRRPAATGEGTVTFAKGTPQQPGAKLSLTATDAKGALVGVAVRNTGGTLLRGLSVTIVATQDGSIERAREVFAQPDIGKAGGRAFEWRPGLTDGSYTITARAELDGILLDQALIGLQLGRVGARRNAAMVVAIAMLFVVLAGLVLGVVMPRRRSGGPRAPGSGPPTRTATL